jgi:hypothetical protein
LNLSSQLSVARSPGVRKADAGIYRTGRRTRPHSVYYRVPAAVSFREAIPFHSRPRRALPGRLSGLLTGGSVYHLSNWPSSGSTRLWASAWETPAGSCRPRPGGICQRGGGAAAHGANYTGGLKEDPGPGRALPCTEGCPARAMSSRRGVERATLLKGSLGTAGGS